jgi:sugar phosphate isomerase/epimerase
VVFLASDVRRPRGGGDDALARLAAETGVEGIHFGGGADLALVDAQAPTILRLGLGMASLALPLPERPLSPGRRLPRLAAHARDEREAAIELALRGLEAATTLGARFAVLDFGEVALSRRAADLALAFARCEMEEDDAGGRLLAAAVAERRARADEILDACRWSLERLVRAAERKALTVALPVAATPWQVPSPREGRLLADAFGGAALGLCWDPGRLSVLATLGLAISDERLRALGETAVLAIENDAVGVQPGYLPGLGEREARVAAIVPGASIPHIVTGGPDATDTEVAAAVRLARRE